MIHPAVDFANTGRNLLANLSQSTCDFERNNTSVFLLLIQLLSILMVLSAYLQGIVRACVQIVAKPGNYLQFITYIKTFEGVHVCRKQNN